MDWKISSLGLLFDGLSFLLPSGLGTIGLAWYSVESFALQAIMVSTGLFLTMAGFLKRGKVSVASSEALMLTCGFLLVLVWYEFAATAMASTPFGDRCAELGDPGSCDIIGIINLIELLFWPAALARNIWLADQLIANKHLRKNSEHDCLLPHAERFDKLWQ